MQILVEVANTNEGYDNIWAEEEKGFHTMIINMKLDGPKEDSKELKMEDKWILMLKVNIFFCSERELV